MTADSREQEIEKIKKMLADRAADPLEPFRNLVKAQKPSPPPPQRAKNLKLVYALLVVVLIALSYGGYRYFKYSRNRSLQEALEKQHVSDLANRYNALVDWRSGIEELNEPKTVDIQESLSRKDGRPLLLSVYLRDLVVRDNKTYGYFSEFGPPDPEISFVLECSPEQITKLRQSTDGDELALVASIKSVSKAESAAEDSKAFVANGECLDLMILNY